MCFHNPMYKLMIVWYAIIIHWIWGCMLLSSPSPLGITAISAVSKFGLVNPSQAALLYFIVSFLAMVGLMAPKWSGLVFLIPQQVVLIVSAWGAINAMVLGQFADGVIRPIPFLVADQAPAVVSAVLYLVALIASFLDKQRT